ncbi:MAG: magnetosome protein MamC [Gammaproteobacteria bacterium]|jgi:hypothetical protein|nr:magnetosome protein MamC [Gammaproteobacteria bacterium]MBT5634554.1 magnetosome protein MamC [Gammaproteobacteria bacterium]MBT8006298.1 magnetosome protein MamC [Gammaproteobacteria bacterium]
MVGAQVVAQAGAQAAPQIAQVAPQVAQVAPQVAPEIAKVAPEIAKVVPDVAQVAPQIAQAAPQVASSLNFVQTLAASTAGIGVIGAVVGASGAAAKNIKDHRDGLIPAKWAVYDTSKEGLGAGVATAASAVAVGAVGGGLALCLGTAVVAATATKYLWDRSIEKIELTLHENDEADEIVAEGAPVEESVEEDNSDRPEYHRRGYEL